MLNRLKYDLKPHTIGMAFQWHDTHTHTHTKNNFQSPTIISKIAIKIFLCNTIFLKTTT
jgi:hypothetical protein